MESLRETVFQFYRIKSSTRLLYNNVNILYITVYSKIVKGHGQVAG